MKYTGFNSLNPRIRQGIKNTLGREMVEAELHHRRWLTDNWQAALKYKKLFKLL